MASEPSAATEPRVIEVDPLSDPRWDELVEAHPRATVHHLGAWAAILASCYRYRPRYLALEDDGRLVGVLPLVSSGRRLSGSRLSSLPTAKAAGPLAASAEQERALLAAAIELGEREGTGGLVVRSQSAGLEGAGVGIEGVGSTQVLDLSCSPEDLLSNYKKTSSNLYRSIRKAEKAGLVVADSDSDRDLSDWYRLYLATIRKHRTLPRRLKQLREAKEKLGEHWRLVTVKHEGAVIAGGVFHEIAGTIELMYNASDAAALPLRPNHALYWHVIREGIERGRDALDFGVSNHESLEQFKQQWGASAHSVFVYDNSGSAEASRADAGSAPPATAAGGSPAPALKARLAARAKGLAGDVMTVTPLSVNRAIGSLAYRIV